MLDFDNRDFTIHKFRQLCEVISGTYPTVTMAEYMDNQHPDRFILMRHDVDRMPGNALRTAKIERDLGIKATYYFRSIKSTFRPEIIKQIEDMGHEIGYHYEVLSEASGDPEKAIELFQSNLDKFRKISDVRTICMHGRPLSKYDNRDLWKYYDFRDFGLIGEAYLSVDKELNYFSDTGRAWGSKSSLRDFIPGKTQHLYADTTDDLVKLIESEQINKFYILTHPERWASGFAEWGLYYSMDLGANLGKTILMRRSGAKYHIPENRSLSVTIDIEDWYHVPSVCGSSFSVYKGVNDFFEQWDSRYDYLSEPTKKPLMSIEDFETSTIKAKKILEKVSGEEVIGYRAPNAVVAGWMLDSLEKIGFKYDSSVSKNSLYNKTDSSLKDVSSIPYHPSAGSLEPAAIRNFVEFPWSYYNIGFKIPTTGGPMLRFLGARLILKGLKQSLNRGHTVFYFHPIDISDEKFPHVGKGRPFYWVQKGKIIEKRIRYILNNLEGVKIVPLKDMLGDHNGI
jgi:peptidoglycan/xylan/chitin deacetylase (PgdA/CDA1 family)